MSVTKKSLIELYRVSSCNVLI